MLAAGCAVLFALALLLRDWRFIVAAALLAAINIGLFFAGTEGAAAEAAPDSKRFLRVVTFNLRFDNDRPDGVDTFLNHTDADVVVLQEVTKDHMSALHQALDARYPYSVGEFGIVIFSKYAIEADGRVDRSGYPEWIRLLARWIEIDVNGTRIEILGVHVARPFYPVLQEHDATTLTQFVLTRKLPIVVAGDFNMTPWTDQLKHFTYLTGLGRFNTFHFTWPMK
ncbi:MAG TPA: endonuclease/exonuclease/phosphatase family protein [Methyloceanibacter sp.]|nr:endonuclease/exonuclease/phosphatase family protein [Methyloceanibacter sp.]